MWEGTYLYGNVPAGDVTVGEELEAERDMLEARREPQSLVIDVSALFEQLQATVQRQGMVSDDVRQELREELEALEAEIMLGNEADEQRIIGHLRRAGDLDLDILELLLSGLRYTRSEAQALVMNAIERARA